MSEQAWKAAFRRFGGCTSCALGLWEPCTDCLGTGWAYGVPAEVLEAKAEIDDLHAALASAQAENERLREALSEISRATTPPEQHGHYLAHRSAVKIARAAVSNTDGGEG